MPRLLCIMGSGETAPTMTSVHQELMERAGSPPGGAVLLDTTFGFQENADEIVAKVQAYFSRSVGRPIGLASLRGREGSDALAEARAVSALREAAYVFSGPGSPSYALQHWRGGQVPGIFAEHLTVGGCLVFSSAAATTIGSRALPVYEIYKVGEPVRWLEGLDLLGLVGLDAAVVPHYDNAEGGTHDTRYCYMGERRLRLLEQQLPSSTWILGVDEHTAFILDLEAGTATVRGRGAAVVRRHGVERRIGAGETVPVGALGEVGARGSQARLREEPAGAAPGAGGVAAGTTANPLTEGVAAHRAAFDAALAGGDVDGMLGTVIALEDHLAAWAHDTLDSDDMDRARSVHRGLLVRLGEVARSGAADPRERMAPIVEMALGLRTRAREERRWADADAVRDALAAAGVEVRDTPHGTEWTLGGPEANPS